MGRTGRQRDGHIIALVTDGKEHQVIILFLSLKLILAIPKNGFVIVFSL